MNEFQMALFDIAPTTTPATAKEATIEERFRAFDRENPHVFETLKTLCLEMKRRGALRWSIKAAYETCRWMPALRTAGSTVKLCNDFHALYSRKLMNEVAELQGFFACRARREKHR